MTTKSVNYDVRIDVKGDKQLRQFQRSVNKLEAQSRKTTRAMQGMQKGMAKLGGLATTVGYAIGAMFSAQSIKAALDYGDAIQKSSDQLGISAEELQGYRFALEQSGGSAALLDKSLKTFSKNIGDASRGTGLLKTMTDDLGISLRDTNGEMKGTDALVKDFGDAVRAASTPAEKLSIAMGAFGRSGASFVTLFEGGANAIDGFKQAAVDAGLVLSENLANQAADVNDRLNIMAVRGRVILSEFLIPLADHLVSAAEGLFALKQAFEANETAMSLWKGTIISVGIVPCIFGDLKVIVAKRGLEFDAVILNGMNENRIPYQKLINRSNWTYAKLTTDDIYSSLQR